MEEQTQDNRPVPVAPYPLTSTPASSATESTSSTPALPTELVADIIDLAVEIIIKEERDLPSQTPITNHFLRAAALVDRTWHSIAAPALLKNGLVTPFKAEQFLAQINKHQMETKLDSVRFGLGTASLADPRNWRADDAKFDALVESLPGLKRVEIVGEGVLLVSELEVGPRTYNQLQVDLYNVGPSRAFIHRKFEQNPPAALMLYESRAPSNARNLADNTVTDRLFATFLCDVQNFSVRSSLYETFSVSIRTVVGFGLAGSPAIRTCHIECTTPRLLSASKAIASGVKSDYGETLQLPNLSHLATHLVILHCLATTGPRPNLASLEVLAHQEEISEVTLEEAECMILELVDLPVLAKLKVPACWKSEAVEDACEAKGIDLRWT
ncbi:hypothetical protein RQP46_003642 [Phenoliferia psychrophenolica]